MLEKLRKFKNNSTSKESFGRAKEEYKKTKKKKTTE